MATVNSQLMAHFNCGTRGRLVRSMNDYLLRGNRKVLKPSLFVDRMDVVKQGVDAGWMTAGALEIPPMLYDVEMDDALLIMESLRTFSKINVAYMLALGFVVSNFEKYRYAVAKEVRMIRFSDVGVTDSRIDTSLPIYGSYGIWQVLYAQAVDNGFDADRNPFDLFSISLNCQIACSELVKYIAEGFGAVEDLTSKYLYGLKAAELQNDNQKQVVNWVDMFTMYFEHLLKKFEGEKCRS